MKETFNELISYLKNPILKKDENTNNLNRFHKFTHLLVISVITGALLTPLFLLIEHLGFVDMNNHAMEELMKNNSKWYVLFFAVILAPLLEELIFRAPITLFREAKPLKQLFMYLLYFLV